MTTNNDYILCRWRDAENDPPEKGFKFECRSDPVATFFAYWSNGEWRDRDGIFCYPKQWLDVTTVPGVPRADVQAAVEGNKRNRYSEAQCPVCGYHCLGRGGVGCIDKPGMLARVTPSEVH